MQFTARFQGPSKTDRGSDKVWGYRQTRSGIIVFWGRVGYTLQVQNFRGGLGDLFKLKDQKLRKGYRPCDSDLVSRMLFA
jgi:predicted DNA-binding WGR domain protein